MKGLWFRVLGVAYSGFAVQFRRVFRVMSPDVKRGIGWQCRAFEIPEGFVGQYLAWGSGNCEFRVMSLILIGFSFSS